MRSCETARGIAREIAAKSPLAVRAAKRSFNVTENMPLRDAYRFEQSQTVALASSEETKEAQRAFAEKRKPSSRARMAQRSRPIAQPSGNAHVL